MNRKIQVTNKKNLLSKTLFVLSITYRDTSYLRHTCWLCFVYFVPLNPNLLVASSMFHFLVSIPLDLINSNPPKAIENSLFNLLSSFQIKFNFPSFLIPWNLIPQKISWNKILKSLYLAAISIRWKVNLPRQFVNLVLLNRTQIFQILIPGRHERLVSSCPTSFLSSLVLAIFCFLFPFLFVIYHLNL